MRTQPDRRLVTLVREGYENAFEEIVRRYGKPLTRYAAAIVGGRAEDVTQDAFSKALLALRRDGAEIELRPWLFRIVRNTALNDLRDRPPSAEVLAEAISRGGTPEEELERREALADLMRRLQSLPEAQRAAIVMRELEGLSHDEIAAALGLSGGGARQAIFRARRALRNGAGMLLPLPLLKALLAGAATTPVEAAAGAAGVGGAAGTGMAIKAATATVLVTGAIGAGAAIDRSHQASPPQPARASGEIADDSTGGAPSASTDETGVDDDSEERSDHSGPGRQGESEPGDDHSANRHSGETDEDRHGDDDHGDRSGPSGHDELETDDGGHRSGRGQSGTSGPGGDESSGSGSSGSSGSGGSSGSETSGGSDDDSRSSGSSGPGSSGPSGSEDSSGSSDESGSSDDELDVEDSSSSSGSGHSGSGEEAD
ncbi:MAG TPA: sigma-70 family RNA polymerase sigma factor [Solirubrobacterales bacterium]|nr:sigma-70 family RNA polymerase sigma factor [Solirubrobacterales bacterium]